MFVYLTLYGSFYEHMLIWYKARKAVIIEQMCNNVVYI